MDTINLTEKTDWAFIEEVKNESGQNPSLCYQCGNCTAGCPYTQYFDYPVSMFMRLLQAGQQETILTSKAILLCATRDMHHAMSLRDRRGPYHGHAEITWPGRQGLRRRTFSFSTIHYSIQ